MRESVGKRERERERERSPVFVLDSGGCGDDLQTKGTKKRIDFLQNAKPEREREREKEIFNEMRREKRREKREREREGEGEREITCTFVSYILHNSTCPNSPPFCRTHNSHTHPLPQTHSSLPTFSLFLSLSLSLFLSLLSSMIILFYFLFPQNIDSE